MCTVSLIPIDDGYRLVTNRDVGRDRAPADEPTWRKLQAHDGPVRALWPTDPDAGGTWVAVNDRGLTLCLLNRTDLQPAGSPDRWTQSRGAIIPALAHLHSAHAAALHATQLDLAASAPCRLIAADPTTCIELTWPGGPGPAPLAGMAPVARWSPLPDRLCWASSGLGDHLVQCRLEPFDRALAADPGPDAQDRFHRTPWPDRPHLAPLMSRDQARTVSITAVSFSPTQGPAMQYQPVPLADNPEYAPHTPAAAPGPGNPAR